MAPKLLPSLHALRALELAFAVGCIGLLSFLLNSVAAGAAGPWSALSTLWNDAPRTYELQAAALREGLAASNLLTLAVLASHYAWVALLVGMCAVPACHQPAVRCWSFAGLRLLPRLAALVQAVAVPASLLASPFAVLVRVDQPAYALWALGAMVVHQLPPAHNIAVAVAEAAVSLLAMAAAGHAGSTVPEVVQVLVRAAIGLCAPCMITVVLAQVQAGIVAAAAEEAEAVSPAQGATEPAGTAAGAVAGGGPPSPMVSRGGSGIHTSLASPLKSSFEASPETSGPLMRDAYAAVAEQLVAQHVPRAFLQPAQSAGGRAVPIPAALRGVVHGTTHFASAWPQQQATAAGLLVAPMPMAPATVPVATVQVQPVQMPAQQHQLQSGEWEQFRSLAPATVITSAFDVPAAATMSQHQLHQLQLQQQQLAAAQQLAMLQQQQQQQQLVQMQAQHAQHVQVLQQQQVQMQTPQAQVQLQGVAATAADQPPAKLSDAPPRRDRRNSDDVSEAFRLARAFVSQSPDQIVYNSEWNYYRLSMKIPQAEPEDLPEQWVSRYQEMLRPSQSLVWYGYVRPGCIQIVLDVIQSHSPNDSASEFPGHRAVPPAHWAHALGPGLRENRAILLQQDASVCFVQDGLQIPLPEAATSEATGRDVAAYGPSADGPVAVAAAVASASPPDVSLVLPVACVPATDGMTVLHVVGRNMRPSSETECFVRLRGSFLPCQAVVYDDPVVKSNVMAQANVPAEVAPSTDILAVAVQLPEATTPGVMAVECARSNVLGKQAPVLLLEDERVVQEVRTLEPLLLAALAQQHSTGPLPMHRRCLQVAAEEQNNAVMHFLRDFGRWIDLMTAVDLKRLKQAQEALSTKPSGQTARRGIPLRGVDIDSAGCYSVADLGPEGLVRSPGTACSSSSGDGVLIARMTPEMQIEALQVQQRDALLDATRPPRLRSLGINLLSFACDRGWPATAACILSGIIQNAGLTLKEVDEQLFQMENMSLAHKVVRSGSVAMLQELLAWRHIYRHTWDFAQPGPFGLTPMHISAVLLDNGQLAECLLSALPPASCQQWFTLLSHDGNTPAAFAAQSQLTHVNEKARSCMMAQREDAGQLASSVVAGPPGLLRRGSSAAELWSFAGGVPHHRQTSAEEWDADSLFGGSSNGQHGAAALSGRPRSPARSSSDRGRPRRAGSREPADVAATSVAPTCSPSRWQLLASCFRGFKAAPKEQQYRRYKSDECVSTDGMLAAMYIVLLASVCIMKGGASLEARAYVSAALVSRLLPCAALLLGSGRVYTHLREPLVLLGQAVSAGCMLLLGSSAAAAGPSALAAAQAVPHSPVWLLCCAVVLEPCLEQVRLSVWLAGAAISVLCETQLAPALAGAAGAGAFTVCCMLRTLLVPGLLLQLVWDFRCRAQFLRTCHTA